MFSKNSDSSMRRDLLLLHWSVSFILLSDFPSGSFPLGSPFSPPTSLLCCSIATKRRRRRWRRRLRTPWFFCTQWCHFCDIFFHFDFLFSMISELQSFQCFPFIAISIASHSSSEHGLSHCESLVFSCIATLGSMFRSAMFKSLSSSPSLQSGIHSFLWPP